MAFDESTILKVWQKGFPEAPYNPAVYRKDRYNFWMKFSDYGNRDSEFGWEIDHINPVALGGSDDIKNLQPLHWKNNVAKSDKRMR